ncbi:MAG: universal stress protein [Spirochaetales bacterium]|nr:universal stress protein [Spirochaetales bacterium]
MFKHLLVPLDGSRLAEAALSPAENLAAKTGAMITLIHVVEKSAPAAIHNDRHLVTAAEAEAYLAEIKERPGLKNRRVETHVHSAEVHDVAHSITEHSAELTPDLIVMTTHGLGSARRFFFGAIAQQVIGMGRIPVLMVRPVEGTNSSSDVRTGDWGTILVPLDGNAFHEKGLPFAHGIARAFHSRVHLLMVVPRFGNLRGSEAAASSVLPGATRLKLEMESAVAEDYLKGRAEELKRDGIETSAETVRGGPARVIIRVARGREADLVVLGTHGKAGADAFWSGSVAARVVERTHVPLLLVPLKE